MTQSKSPIKYSKLFNILLFLIADLLLAGGGQNCWGKGLQKGARGWEQEVWGKGDAVRGVG